jgi:hypothetical protein
MLLVRSLAQRPSNNPVATESASRCCLPISSVSSGSVVSGCAAHAVRKTSSRLLGSLRTYAASLSCWRDRRLRLPRVLRERQAALRGAVSKRHGCRSDWSEQQKTGRTGVRRETIRQFFTDFCNRIGTGRSSTQPRRPSQESEDHPTRRRYPAAATKLSVRGCCATDAAVP